MKVAMLKKVIVAPGTLSAARRALYCAEAAAAASRTAIVLAPASVKALVSERS